MTADGLRIAFVAEPSPTKPEAVKAARPTGSLNVAAGPDVVSKPREPLTFAALVEVRKLRAVMMFPAAA